MVEENLKTCCKACSPNSPFGCHSHEKGNLYRFPIEPGMTNRNGSARERTQHLCIGISMFPYFAPQAQIQKSIKTAMDGSFRNFEKVSQDSLTCRLNANQHGFTLIEMMIAVVLSLIVISGVYEVFTSQQKAYSIQDQVAEMQQNARVAMDMMARSLRSAAYDPREQNLFGFTDSSFKDSNDATLILATNQKIYLTIDDDEDGVIDTNTTERVGYKLNASNLEIGTAITAGAISTWTALAENITALTFTYTYADGGVSSADPPGLPDNTADGDNTNDFEDIRVIQISVTARTAREDPGFLTGYDLDPSRVGTCRTRTLTANVRPRNLGL